MNNNYQYYLQYWGQVRNDNWIERDLGIKGTNFWFDTSDERTTFKRKLKACADAHNCIIVFDEQEGVDTHLRTIACMTMCLPDGRKFDYRYDFGYAYPEHAARFMFSDGNYDCDCNKSLFLLNEGYDVPEMECGNTIVLDNFNIIKE